jgi:hypothetical protein
MNSPGFPPPKAASAESSRRMIAGTPPEFREPREVRIGRVQLDVVLDRDGGEAGVGLASGVRVVLMKTS